MLQDVFRYCLKRKDEIYVKRKITSIVRLYLEVMTVVRCTVEKKKRGDII